MTKTKWEPLLKAFAEQQNKIREGGGPQGQERQKRLERLTARERIDQLFDKPEDAFELSLWAGYEMYEEWGGLPSAGVVGAIGNVEGRPCMVIANDATVKAGAMFPQSVKKLLRAQRIAFECKLPILYLVDSSGVFLPLQEDIFPDEDDFGRIFRNNAVISAAGIPQFAAIMGNCIAGGGYLPVLCDKLLMTRGSGLYLAGPALVKAAIGQVVDTEDLGGAEMHASISGTVDFLEEDDTHCLNRLRALVGMLPKSAPMPACGAPDPAFLDLMDPTGKTPYDVRDLLKLIVDKETFLEYKAQYGQTLVCGYAKLNGNPIGIVASQRKHSKTARGEVELGGVVYSDSADKASRFILDCNQTKVPLLFIQDVSGFMVGKDAEQSGIIRSGAKMVNALSNSVVPKITLIVGNSFGAGHYALCGKAYDPSFIIAWPNAKYAVMGADQASDTLLQVQQKAAERKGNAYTPEQTKALKEVVKASYEKQIDIRYGAARGWIDALIDPQMTRSTLIQLFDLANRGDLSKRTFHTGVFQV
jgi:acetyl-CoA carboxylase carboxyltransferase component